MAERDLPMMVSTNDSPERAEASLARRILPKLGVSLLLGGLFAWLVAEGGVPLLPPARAFAHLELWGVAAYVGLVVVTHFFRASRWRFLVAPIQKVPFRDVILLNWIGFFAIFAFPLRLGELARPALTKMRNGIPLSAGIGTIAVERVVDGLIMSLCVAWALFALPRHTTEDEIARLLPTYGYLSLGVFVSAFIALGLFLWQRSLATAVVERTVGIVSPRMGRLVASKVASVADGVRSIADARLAAGFAFETSIYWLLNAFGIWVLGVACGIPMTFAHAIAIMGILGIGILLPAGPGLFGNFQLAISAGLRLYFAEALVGEQGAVLIFVMYTIQAVLIVLMGVTPLYAMRIPFSALLRVGTPGTSVPPPPSS
jgi:hypothetical protein